MLSSPDTRDSKRDPLGVSRPPIGCKNHHDLVSARARETLTLKVGDALTLSARAGGQRSELRDSRAAQHAQLFVGRTHNTTNLEASPRDGAGRGAAAS